MAGIIRQPLRKISSHVFTGVQTDVMVVAHVSYGDRDGGLVWGWSPKS